MRRPTSLGTGPCATCASSTQILTTPPQLPRPRSDSAHLDSATAGARRGQAPIQRRWPPRAPRRRRPQASGVCPALYFIPSLHGSRRSLLLHSPVHGCSTARLLLQLKPCLFKTRPIMQDLDESFHFFAAKCDESDPPSQRTVLFLVECDAMAEKLCLSFSEPAVLPPPLGGKLCAKCILNHSTIPDLQYLSSYSGLDLEIFHESETKSSCNLILVYGAASSGRR